MTDNNRRINDEQAPPIARPELRPVWDQVIEDATARYGEYLKDPGDDPVAAANRAVVEQVIADMRERDKVGRAKYGVPLTTNNGRDQVVDAYQEVLDASVYVRAAAMEGEEIPFVLYASLLDSLMYLRRVIDARKEKQS